MTATYGNPARSKLMIQEPFVSTESTEPSESTESTEPSESTESTESTELVYCSEIKNAIYDVVIDFDDASRCWTANKRRLKNGCYQYICGAQLKNGNKCQKKPMYGIDSDSFACSIHLHH
jgi:hypothetical protein